MPFPISSLLTLPAKNFLDLTLEPNANISFSQFGEDLILDYYFFEKNSTAPSLYVDIGCYHPVKYSNTLLLALRGWHGLNIDANPDAIKLFEKHRPRDRNICCGIGPTAGTANFYRFEIGAVSTLSPRQAQIWQDDHGWKMRDVIKTPVRPINDLLAEASAIGRRLAYLNIDIEGLDRDVITQIDFSRFRPDVISIELHNANAANLAADPAVACLLKEGYDLLATCVATYIFARAH